MKTVSGSINLILALMFFVLSGLAVTGIPGAFGMYAQEPEDLLMLLVLVPLLALIGFVALLTGIILLRGRALAWISASSVAVAALSGAVLLLVLSLLGFMANEPSSAELRFLSIPAVALGWSYFLIKTQIVIEREIAAQ